MAHDLAVHQAELERIKFSEARLRNASLSEFIYPNQHQRPAGLSAASKIAVNERLPRPEAVSAVMGQPVTNQPLPTVNQPMATLPMADGLGQPMAFDNSLNTSYFAGRETTDHEPLDHLLNQLQQLSEQVEELRGRSGNRLAA